MCPQNYFIKKMVLVLYTMYLVFMCVKVESSEKCRWQSMFTLFSSPLLQWHVLLGLLSMELLVGSLLLRWWPAPRCQLTEQMQWLQPQNRRLPVILQTPIILQAPAAMRRKMYCQMAGNNITHQMALLTITMKTPNNHLGQSQPFLRPRYLWSTHRLPCSLNFW